MASSVSTFPLCTRTIVSTAWLCVSATFALTSAILSAGSSSTSNLAFVLRKRWAVGRGQHVGRTRNPKGGGIAVTFRETVVSSSWTIRIGRTLAGREKGGKDLAPTRRVAGCARDRGRESRATASGTHSVLNVTFMVTVRVFRVWGDVTSPTARVLE